MSNLSENLQTMTRETTGKLAKFRQMVEQSKFDIAYQPIVDLETEVIHHFEALARFGKRLDRSPYELIRFAEDTGVIAEFELAMVQRVLNWLVQEISRGMMRVVAVNVSGQSIANTIFVNALHNILHKFDAIRFQFMFEITESSRIDDLETANRFIQGLQKAGHKVCLDDFGSGEAALRYLHALEVDVVKIDGQYVRSAMERPRNKAFLKAITGLCHNLGITTIAEMIEEDDQADTRSLKDEIVQWANAAMVPYMFYERASMPLDETMLNKKLAAKGLILVRMSAKLAGPLPLRIVHGDDVNHARELAGRPLLVPGTVVVSKTLAARHNLKTGDVLRLDNRDGNHRFDIIEITDDIGYYAEDGRYIDIKSNLVFSNANPIFADYLERTLGDYGTAR